MFKKYLYLKPFYKTKGLKYTSLFVMEKHVGMCGFYKTNDLTRIPLLFCMNSIHRDEREKSFLTKTGP